MRELAPWDADAGLERSFADIEALAAVCRFNDCAHDGEPGCAVASAIDDGDLAASRFDGWRKLEREARHLERRVDALARAEERRKWKVIHKSVGKHMELEVREGWLMIASTEFETAGAGHSGPPVPALRRTRRTTRAWPAQTWPRDGPRASRRSSPSTSWPTTTRT